MYKIFLDSIILKIDYDNDDKLYNYNQIITKLKQQNYHLSVNINQKLLNKFDYMYLLRDNFTQNLLSVIKLNEEDNTTATDVIFVYALKSGIYIEINGLVQYKRDYRKEKFALISYLWNNFTCTITKLDIAIDFEVKMQDIQIFDKQWQPLSKGVKFTDSIHYFNVPNKQHRRLKLYYKSTQKFRSFPVAWDITRLELTLKGDLVKGLKTFEALSIRVQKELANFKYSLNQQEINILMSDIEEFSKNLFSLLETGKQTKRYSNYLKNIDTSVRNMQTVWNTLNSTLTLKEIAQANNISLRTLKKYRHYFKKLTLF